MHPSQWKQNKNFLEHTCISTFLHQFFEVYGLLQRNVLGPLKKEQLTVICRKNLAFQIGELILGILMISDYFYTNRLILLLKAKHNFSNISIKIRWTIEFASLLHVNSIFLLFQSKTHQNQIVKIPAKNHFHQIYSKSSDNFVNVCKRTKTIHVLNKKTRYEICLWMSLKIDMTEKSSACSKTSQKYISDNTRKREFQSNYLWVHNVELVVLSSVFGFFLFLNIAIISYYYYLFISQVIIAKYDLNLVSYRTFYSIQAILTNSEDATNSCTILHCGCKM